MQLRCVQRPTFWTLAACLLPVLQGAARLQPASTSLRTGAAHAGHHHHHRHHHHHHHRHAPNATAEAPEAADDAGAAAEAEAQGLSFSWARANASGAAAGPALSFHSANSSAPSPPLETLEGDGGDAVTINRLESQLSEMVRNNERASPAIQAFVEVIRALIKDDLKPKILSQHEQSQRFAAGMKQQIDSCSAGKDEAEANKKLNLATRTSSSERHKACRKKESELFQRMDTCMQLLSAKDNTRKIACKALDEMARDPHEMAHNCETTAPAEPWGLWLKRNRKWFEEQEQRWEIQQAKCSQARSEYDTTVPGCRAKEEKHNRRKALCDSMQDQLETAACTYAQGMSHDCETYQSCYKASKLRYEEALPVMKAQEENRRSEWRGVLRIECLLGLFDSSQGGEQKVQECKAQQADTSHLDIKYETISAVRACGPLPLVPGAPAFEEKEYKDLPKDARSKAMRACVVSAKGGISVGRLKAQPKEMCDFDGEYLLAQGGASCLLATTLGEPVVVDYTKARYTTYRFTVKMYEMDTRNNNISPHAGFDVCNRDGTSWKRGNSPEFWFIDRDSDWGYGIYHQEIGFQTRYTDKGYYGAAEPKNLEDKEWEITVEYIPGVSLKVFSWKVQGVPFDNYKGVKLPCPTKGDDYAFTPRIWAYGASDKIYAKDFQALQGDNLGLMIPIVGAAVLS